MITNVAQQQPSTIDYGADVSPPPQDNILASLDVLANQALDADAAVVKATEALAAAKAAYTDLVERQLPELMDAARQIELTTASNIRVKVADQVHAAIPKDPVRQAPAFALLRAKSLGAIIKNEIDMAFEAGRDKEADGVVLLMEVIATNHSLHDLILNDLSVSATPIQLEAVRRALVYLTLTKGQTVNRTQGVHPQTLAANIRELLAAGKITPAEMETLGANAKKVASVKRKD